MSCIIDFIRFIFCCYLGEDEEKEPIHRNYENYQRSYSLPTPLTPLIIPSPTQRPNKVRNLSEKSTVGPQVIRNKTSISTSKNLPQKLKTESENASIFPSPKSQRPSSPKSQRPLSKPNLEPLDPSSSTNRLGNITYECFQKGTSPTYSTPEDLKFLFKKDIVPPVLKKDIIPSIVPSPIQRPNNVKSLSEKSTVGPQVIRNKTSISTSNNNIPQKLKIESDDASILPSKSQRPSSTKSQRPLSPKSHRSSSPKSQRPLSPKSHRSSSPMSQRPSSPKSQRPSSSKSQRPSSPKPQRPSSPKSKLSKPTLEPLDPSTSTNRQGKTKYVWVQKGTSPTYSTPEDLKNLFKRDIVPPVLKKDVTPSTYKEYFETLLYAEDFYIEKWNEFKMIDLTLELHEAAIYKKGGKGNVNHEQDDKVFVAFKMDTVPERRPFLLSRDFVTVRPSGNESVSYQGVIYRVVKSNLVLVEFKEDFHQQHNPWYKYDVQFSFNRVCLKRAHQAIISAASNPLFQNLLFPDSLPKFKNNTRQTPDIIEGPLFVNGTKLSNTGQVIRDRILLISRTFPSCHILICAPTNKICDVITQSLQGEISDIFRANAAFRELDGVPMEIIPNCRYKKEVFSCPPLDELCQFKVVVSTFMSAFRLYNEGVKAGHFSHIILVDTSSTTEPEAMVALANLADDETVVVVSGSVGNRSSWVRSSIARRHGLMVSFFERLRQRELYQNLDYRFIAQMEDS